jgi:hypothetical protein
MKKRLLEKDVKRGSSFKKKRKCFNCEKKKYFVKKYRSFKTNHTKIDNPKKKRERRIYKKP